MVGRERGMRVVMEVIQHGGMSWKCSTGFRPNLESIVKVCHLLPCDFPRQPLPFSTVRICGTAGIHHDLSRSSGHLRRCFGLKVIAIYLDETEDKLHNRKWLELRGRDGAAANDACNGRVDKKCYVQDPFTYNFSSTPASMMYSLLISPGLHLSLLCLQLKRFGLISHLSSLRPLSPPRLPFLSRFP